MVDVIVVAVVEVAVITDIDPIRMLYENSGPVFAGLLLFGGSNLIILFPEEPKVPAVS